MKYAEFMSRSVFSHFDQILFFWVNLVQNIKTVSLSWNLVPGVIRICRIHYWCSLFQFLTGNTLLGKFGRKNENCQFKLKLGTKTNLNMRNSVVLCFWLEIPFSGKFYAWSWSLVPKNFKYAEIIRCSLFSNFYQIYLGVDFVKKIRIFSLCWNLVPKLIQVFRV